MSQLVKAVMAYDTGNRKVLEDKFSPLFADVFERKEDVNRIYNNHEIGKKYRIGVTLGSEVIVSDFECDTSEDALAHAIIRTKKSIIEAAFGEFREDIMRLQNAIYDRDFQKARSLLTDFEKKMFEV